MTCAACQGTVERALTRTDGVSAASVNLMLHAATVTYDPAAVDVPRMLAAVRDVGYDAAPPAADNLLGAPSVRARCWRVRRRTAGCGSRLASAWPPASPRWSLACR